uniref:Uncharacterized protein n=1 Tax=Thermosporothrix sp. COM3 TaxID=2490863 RepID=A0A455SJL1_9CHLR|nr:hypothetical protein KTC_18900 [Thermosporothrix sp. COM3]
MGTLADYTQLLRADLPDTIISEEAFQRIQALTCHFPDALANRIFCFELHLREQGQYVDFSLHFSADADGQQQLLNHITPQLNKDPVWQKLYHFASLWNDQNSFIHHGTNHVWLEFDLDRPASLLSTPGLFYCQHCSIDQLTTIQALAEVFYGKAEQPRVQENLQRCLQAIPNGAHVNQVGFGLLRNQGTIRLQVMRITPHDLPSYLEAVGWPGSTGELEPLLRLLPRFDMLTLLLDVSTEVQPKIGVECFFARYDKRLPATLSELTDRGLCNRAQHDFLIAFSGIKLYQLDYQISITHRFLSHIKFGYDPGRTANTLEAKAYLFYHPSWQAASIIEPH